MTNIFVHNHNEGHVSRKRGKGKRERKKFLKCKEDDEKIIVSSQKLNRS